MESSRGLFDCRSKIQRPLSRGTPYKKGKRICLQEKRAFVGANRRDPNLDI